jgi:branched-chain amino acid transport system substrate-binding protein
MLHLPRICLALVLSLQACLAFAAEDILIGQTADLSSVAGQQMKDFNAGAQAYFSQVNAKGGVKGRQIRLITKDDAFAADKATVNAKELIAKDGVIALFGSRGTDPTEAVIKVAEATKTPLVAPISGADSMRDSRYVFPVRAGYRDEVRAMLDHISFVPSRLAVLVQDDKFGNPLFGYIDQALREKYRTTQLVSTVRFPRKKTDLAEEVGKILNAEPNAVIALCNPTSCENFMRQIHEQAAAKSKPRPTIYQTSISDMYAQFKKLGPGMVAGNPFSQITPDPHRGVNTQVKDYRAAMEKAQAPLNYRSYEGFLSAVVMVEALKRSKGLNREDLHQALEQGLSNGIELGDLSVKYTADLHRGSQYVDLVTIDRDGRLVH